VKRNLCACCILYFSLLPQAVVSQELETTYVFAKSKELNLVSSISLDEQDYAYETLDTLLQKSPGVQTQIAGATGSYSSVWIRGASSVASGIFIDGIKINDPLNGGVNLSTLPLWAFESIDIYKSNLPAHIGFGDANNGISLNTRDSASQIENTHDLRFSYGSFNQYSASISSYANNSLISAEYFTAENNFSYRHDNNTQFNQLDDYQTKRNNNQVERAFALFKNQQTINNLDVTSLLLARNYQSGIGNQLNQAKNAYIDQSSIIAALAMHPKNQSHWQANLNITVADHLYDDLKSEIGLSSDKQTLNYQEINHSITFNNTFDTSLSSSPWHSSTHLTLSHLTLEGQEITQNQIKDLDLERNQYAMSQTIAKGGFQAFILFGSSRRIQKQQQYWSIGSHYEFEVASLPFIASASRKIRLPSISELYINQGSQSGNADLTPETFNELAIKTEFHQSYFGLDIESFFRKSEDSIVFSYNAQGVGRAENLGESILYGIDLSAYTLINHLKIDSSISLMKSENQIDHSTYSGKLLPNLFHFTAFLSASYPVGQWQLGVENIFQSGLYYDTANSQKADDQVFLNATLDRPFKYGLVAIKVNNVLNKQYTGFKTEPLPRRSGVISVQIQL